MIIVGRAKDDGNEENMLKLRGTFSFDPTDPLHNHLIGQFTDFSFQGLVTALGLEINLPKVITNTVFPKGATLVFTTSEKGTRM